MVKRRNSSEDWEPSTDRKKEKNRRMRQNVANRGKVIKKVELLLSENDLDKSSNGQQAKMKTSLNTVEVLPTPKCRHRQNYVPFADQPFLADHNYVKYAKATLSERREFVLTSSKSVTYVETNNQRQGIRNFRKKIDNDPQLAGYFKYDTADEDMKEHLFDFLARRVLQNCGRKKKRQSQKKSLQIQTLPTSLDFYAQKQSYIPPTCRIRILENITFNKIDVIPVFSDIDGETCQGIELPDTLLYDYNDINRLNAVSESKLGDAIDMAQDDRNIIKCTCCSSEPIVPCYMNENCPCYMTNKKLQMLQSNRTKLTEFSTFNPTVFHTVTDIFFNCAGFACSEDCACKGACTNNSLFLLQKKIFPLEIYRSDPDVGFNARCSVMIPHGTPIMEFVGDLFEQDDLSDSILDYPYQISYPGDDGWYKVVEKMEWTEEYKELLKGISQNVYYLNPRQHGNVGRTLCHSCTANTEVVRVYQKSISPAHLHLVVVSLEDIYPGIPITFDYGVRYVTEQLDRKCKCGSFACCNGPHYKEYSQLTKAQLVRCFRRLNEVEDSKWRKLLAENEGTVLRELHGNCRNGELNKTIANE